MASGSNAAADRDPVLRLPLMEAELASRTIEGGIPAPDESVSIEELRTSIADAKTAAEFGVRKSQLEFYGAFSDGDVDAMDAVWSAVSHVQCVHPGMASLDGREAVMGAWRQIFSATARDRTDGAQVFTIEPARVRIDICGTTAICTCAEKTQNGGRLEAINVYKREGGSWKMTLHQAAPVIMASSVGN